MKTFIILMILAATVHTGCAPATPLNLRQTPFAQWSRGPSSSPDFFPISVWMQDPRDAAKYKAAGINMYKNLWAGPTAEQLDRLRAAGMPVVCEQNEYALAHLDDPIIVGWLHGDEPDNAHKIEVWESPEAIRQAWPDMDPKLTDRPLAKWGPYGPPISPIQVRTEYERIVANDPTRPVWLHLGQAVAWDNYKGRGVRSGRNEDYLQYVQAAHVTNFDIYPSVHKSPEIRGKLEWVAGGVSRLRTWTKDRQVVSVAIECTRIGDPTNKPKPRHVKAEVWMSITHGARAICYFVHEFVPTLNANGLLDDPEMLAAVTAINKQIHSLAPVINSPTVEGVVSVASSNAKAPISAITKRFDGNTYIFAVDMRAAATKATFTVADMADGTSVEVIGEDRSIAIEDGEFTDAFTDYDVHLYRMTGGK